LIMKHILFYSVLMLLLTACKTYSEEEKSNFNQEVLKIAKKKDSTVRQSSSGLCVIQLEEGIGEEVIKRGSKLKISYKGTLKNGKVFDQTEPDVPFEANLTGLIGGFQEGLLGQKKGAKLILVVPPHLGYGDEKTGEIPGNSILIFELEVVDFI
jgi:FKBP-type peptidyl-prolyl cis-trans isomerase